MTARDQFVQALLAEVGAGSNAVSRTLASVRWSVPTLYQLRCSVALSAQPGRCRQSARGPCRRATWIMSARCSSVRSATSIPGIGLPLMVQSHSCCPVRTVMRSWLLVSTVTSFRPVLTKPLPQDVRVGDLEL
jgi:hypothetical protein